MTNQHSITPPDKLVMKWWDDGPIGDHIGLARYMADQASRWGSDQELEACCEWLKTKEWIHPEFSDELRAARRPKPPSLKEQALEALYQIESECPIGSFGETIRRALEQLDD